MTSELEYHVPNEYTNHEHYQNTNVDLSSTMTLSISSSPAISNSSSAASSASTLPVVTDQQIDDESTAVSTPVEQLENENCKRKVNAGDFTSVRVAVRLVIFI